MKNDLKFNVGPWRYSVMLSDGKLYDDQGHEVDGICCWTIYKIWISGEVPSEGRIEVLLHELSHAWCQHFGRPTDVESFCNFVAAFTTDIMRQLLKQGGEAALLKMRSVPNAGLFAGQK